MRIGKIGAAAALAAGMAAQEAGRFEEVATYRGHGALVASAVGPGPTEGSQRFYASYLYVDHTFDVVAVDPETGEHRVFENPVPGEYGARCMAVGPDGNVYLGTLARAHFVKLDPRTGEFTDLGRPSATEQYIWDAAFGSDGKLYGATYPQSKLVRYDPATGRVEDLGRLDAVEQYARWIAASDDGFVYVGIGTTRANIAVYEIATGERREILPPEFQAVSTARVYRGTDGKVYGYVGAQYFRLEGWSAVPIARGAAAAQDLQNRLADGRTVTAVDNTLRITDPVTRAVTERRFEYEGNELNLFRVGMGPDREIYASAVLPIHFLKLDAEAGRFRYLGGLGGGEIYSFLAHGPWLLMAAYGGNAPLMRFDPSKPFWQGAGEKNPLLVDYGGSDSGWRPQAFINGPGGRVYLGAVSGYGKLGGPLTVWDAASGEVNEYPHVVADQSVVSLAAWKDWIVGGTTTGGGGGSRPTQKEAKLFLWDPKRREKLFEMVPVAGQTSVTGVTAAPNGLVYGLAGRNLFVFDPEAREVVARKATPFASAVYNSIAAGPDGRLWGLATSGVFAIDTSTHDITMAAESPRRISAGFLMDGRAIYFVSKATLYRYLIPEPAADTERRGPAPAIRLR